MSVQKYSRIIAGVMKWGAWGAQLTTKEMAYSIAYCRDHGITTFDHADIYGGHTSEEEWGKAWASINTPRDKIQIITKCGIMMPSDRSTIALKHYNTSTGHIIHSVEHSLKMLNTEYIDMLLIHRPSPLMNPDDIAKAVDLLKKSGKIIEFGVSNFTPSQCLLIDTAVDISANQIEISPFNLAPFTDGTLDFCTVRKYIPMAWSPLGGGKLFNNSYPLISERLSKIASKYNWTLDEMIYLFLLHHPSKIHIVVGTSKAERLATAAEATHTIISDAQWFEIWTAITGEPVA